MHLRRTPPGQPSTKKPSESLEIVMASTPFHYVDCRTFCYGTEQESRVEAALGTFLPEEAEVMRAETEGHLGNRILVLSARIETAPAVRTVLERLKELPEAERVQLRNELEARIDENCSLFITFDKQAAFNGDVRLGDGITFRGKVEAYPATKENALAAAEDTFEAIVSGG